MIEKSDSKQLTLATASILRQAPSQISSADIYTDFHGLAELRAQARDKSPNALQEVARQFEGMFIQLMLKSMRDATAATGDGTDGEQVKFYQQMFDQQIALDLSNGQGIGLTSVIARQIGAEQGSIPIDSENAISAVQGTEAVNRYKTISLEKIPAATSAPLPETSSVKNWKPENPESFVHELWPHATRVASSLGLQPEVLIAQAALETGWGKKMIQGIEGNSMNLFGIKADSRWSGEKATVSTLEYRDGVAVKEKASFRSYDNIAGSLEDYAEFLRSNPRYQSALSHTADAGKFLEGLQEAGYATDPKYAEKISSIMEGSTFTKAIKTLKSS